MQESKELQKLHVLFRLIVYLSIILEIICYTNILDVFSGHNEYIMMLLVKMRSLSVYKNLLLSKGLTILLVCITSIGTKAKKRIDFNMRTMVIQPLLLGLSIVGMSIISYKYIPDDSLGRWALYGYAVFSLLGILFVMSALDSLSKIFHADLGGDKFNLENESFMQTQEKVENEYSVNIPTQFYYKGKMNHGWINLTNPFRGTWVIGTPGSGKTFSIIEPIMRQHAAKGFSLVVYDYKFPTLGRKLYYLYQKHKKLGNLPSGCEFRVINFTHVEYSHRINPIQRNYIPNLAAASETASTLIESLLKGKSSSGGADDFFKTSAENFLAATIYFFTRVGNGRYSSMAHVLSFLNQDYTTIFDVLLTNKEVKPLLAPFLTAYQNKAMDQLEGMIGTLRVHTGRLATKEAFWIFTGNDFSLKVSDPKSPCYLLLANDPEMESLNGALNALILNRLVTQVNSGEGNNIPCNIIVDELPTLYFHKIDRLVGTARSNKVAVTLGFQDLPQLEADYSKVGMQKVISICGNVICASARHKETLDWMSSSIFGKVRQIKKGVTVDQSKTSLSLNEEMGDLVPASKIADMPTGFLCGQTARDFVQTKVGWGGSIDIQSAEEFQTTKFFAKTCIDQSEVDEEKLLAPSQLPIVYNFGSDENKEKLLTLNYEKVTKEVQELCALIKEKNS